MPDVQKANYRLEIRMFHKGSKRLKQNDLCIMKCPVITSRLGEQRVRCHPSFIQVTAWKALGGSGRVPVVVMVIGGWLLFKGPGR